jgi:hypothetical protein
VNESQQFHDAGLPPASAPPLEDQVVAAYAAGKPVEVIAAWFGIGADEVERIVAHQAGAGAPSTPATGSRRRPSRRWPWAVGAAAAVLLIGGLAGSIWYDRHRSDARQATPRVSSPFLQLQSTCDPSRAGTTVTDNGQTLLVDSSGEEDFGKLPSAGLDCVLDGLSMPDAVRSHMLGTRALDGRQEDAWPGFTASWSYHPNQGLDLIVRTSGE